jgi:tol-pal system protein YbgF
VLQLEEEIRALNGRIEEMSFQLLQMQEQIRKSQEDNEFRFQELEKSGARKSGSLEPSAQPAPPKDSVAQIITSDPPPAAGPGAPAQQLGSIELDASGMPKSATISDPSKDGSALPGVTSGVSLPPPAATAPPVASAADPASPQIASLNNEADVYQAAYGHVLSGDYAIAEAEFREFVERYPQSKKIADANFWLGEAQYSQGNYNEAAKTFLNGHQAHSTSPKAPEMLLKLGMSLAALDNKDTACATMREVSKRYPKASRAVIQKTSSEMKRLSC